MSKRKGIDLKNLPIIDESEVPDKPKRYTPYRELFKRIGNGKALVLTDNDVNLTTARAALRRLQRKGEFKQMMATQRTVEGKRTLYIINPSDKKEGNQIKE